MGAEQFLLDERQRQALLETLQNATKAIQETIDHAVQQFNRPSVLYQPKLSIDGDKICALYGEDLMSGCAGFGETVKDAMEDFDRNWNMQKIARTIAEQKSPMRLKDWEEFEGKPSEELKAATPKDWKEQMEQQWPGKVWRNQAMKTKLESREALDVSKFRRKDDHKLFDLPADFYQEGKDYCDAEREEWIRSVGKNVQHGRIVASLDKRFYGNAGWTCLWLR